MNTRRNFFKQLAGQIGVLNDEFHGVECIPLSRLKELPDKIIRGIEPVFFPDEVWEIRNHTLYTTYTTNDMLVKSSDLSSIELQSIEYFKRGFSLEKTASKIRESSELSFDEIYKIVSLLFFKLASLHICHPRKIYHIDEILKSGKTDG